MMIYCYDYTIPIAILFVLRIITLTSFTVELDIHVSRRVQVLPMLKSGVTVFPQRLRTDKKGVSVNVYSGKN